jgi:predicted dithiol-disulfide oxidoreductase (DUF899 family)
MDLREKIEAVASQRRKLPLGGKIPEDYAFEEVDVATRELSTVRLSELFTEGKNSLIVYGFMFGPDWNAPCPACKSFTDAVNGIAPHVRARTNFAFVAKAQPDKLMALASKRHWTNIRFLSSFENAFNAHYFAEFEGEHGDHHPMVNVFVKSDGQVHHFWGGELFSVPVKGAHPRHIDLLWPLWNFFDLTPEGRGGFWPRLEY